MKKGLVLEGGAMRGLFTAGVMDVMMENGIEYDGAIGVSAGAAFGCNYKSRQIGRVLRYNTNYCNDWRFCSWRSLLTTGDLYGAEFCYDTIPNKLDVFDGEAFVKNPMEFYVTCTDADSGKPLYKRLTTGFGSDIKWIQGSASMPVVSRAVEVDGYRLLDGGISDSIPLKYFESIGYDRNVVVLTQPKSYRKEPQKHLGLIKRALKSYPAIPSRLEDRYARYNGTVKYVHEQAKAGSVFVIQPDEPLNIGSIEHNPEELRRVYGHGREVATRKLSELIEFMGV